jgi:glycosyltransferase involved in cell wall biosynthesis
MRVLAITNMYPTTRALGLGTFVEQQVESLRQSGLIVDVLFVDRVRDGMAVYLGLRKQLRARIAEFQPDIVHVMYGGIMADLVTGAIKDRPTVVTFHGTDLLGEQLSGFVRNRIAGYGVWASWRSARRASGIVVVAAHLLDALPRDIDRLKVRIIPCGIDLRRFKVLDRNVCRARLGWAPDRFHVLFPSNAGNAVKRPELARAAVAAANRLGAAAEIHYLRGVSNAEVPAWINASDVLLLTSRHEGSPTIVKEALACCLPVVSVEVGDVGEQMGGVEGCHLASADAEDLAAKLLVVRARAQRLKPAARIQELSVERIALRLRRFYDELAAPTVPASGYDADDEGSPRHDQRYSNAPTS